MRKMTTQFIAFVCILSIALIAIECKKSDSTATPPTAINPVQAKLHSAFDTHSADQDFSTKLRGDTSLKWMPNWDGTTSSKKGDSITYFTPLIPQLFINGQENRSITFKVENTAKYLIAYTYDTTCQIFLGTYTSLDSANTSYDSPDFFNAFSGTLTIRDLATNLSSYYIYSNGKVTGRSAGRNGRYIEKSANAF
ncbi:hypothetical protein [Deminuibacter soli]|uniref:Uncharacterized protein n=1 Tax=Deminuibacter soli TaxID=2291815 RepID=A0A3E1NPB1_9BACT|nr:hypothetical protein [Deminuibacter soli]RFM29771.1 hypothetical protein DXN05_01985 [Deminuibacter soli]